MSVRRKFEPPENKKAYPSACPQCGGSVEERRITLVYPLDATSRMIRGVPAGVCQSCGERFLRPEVTTKIEKLLATRPSGVEEVPVWDFVASA